jgi:hypothetical protein
VHRPPRLRRRHLDLVQRARPSAPAGQAATAIRAPSHLLTAARSAADLSANGPRPTAPEPAVAGNPRGGAGAVEDILHRLGVTSPDLLQRAADIDQAGEQLIIEAAARAKDHELLSHATPGRSAGSRHPSTTLAPPATRAPPTASPSIQKQNTDHQRQLKRRSRPGTQVKRGREPPSPGSQLPG